MTISRVEINIVQLISFLGIVQGLGWAVLSFICIVLHNISKNINFDILTYEEALQASLYYRFIKESSSGSGVTVSNNFVVRPTDFTVFMWIYFLSSAIWVALSIDQYIAAKNDKRRLSTVMILWSVDAILFSIVDIILMSLLARDYENCENLDVMCHVITGITMTLAARGYLLWFINIICCVSLLKLGIRMKKHDFAQRNVVIPRPKLGPSSEYNNGNNGWSNSNFLGRITVGGTARKVQKLQWETGTGLGDSSGNPNTLERTRDSLE